jgi:thiol-disulfide isomerase/thioredoxin
VTGPWAIPERGYWLRPINERPREGEGWRHVFCGSHATPGAWCPNCDKPLLRYAAFDCRDGRLAVQDGLEDLPLFYCWTCNVADGDLQYQLLRDGSVRLLAHGKGREPNAFVLDDHPSDFPEVTVRLDALTENEQLSIQRLNREEVSPWDGPQFLEHLSVPAHQVGGEPYLVQLNPSYRLLCASCRDTMPFLCAFGDAATGPAGFTGEEYVQVLFHFCRRCRVVGAFHQCD